VRSDLTSGEGVLRFGGVGVLKCGEEGVGLEGERGKWGGWVSVPSKCTFQCRPFVRDLKTTPYAPFLQDISNSR
jgi:hypothetical protein